MKDKSGQEPPDEAERQAAWEAFKALRNAGWTSDGRKLSRDELYDREAPTSQTVVKTPPSGEQD